MHILWCSRNRNRTKSHSKPLSISSVTDLGRLSTGDWGKNPERKTRTKHPDKRRRCWTDVLEPLTNPQNSYPGSVYVCGVRTQAHVYMHCACVFLAPFEFPPIIKKLSLNPSFSTLRSPLAKHDSLDGGLNRTCDWSALKVKCRGLDAGVGKGQRKRN